MDGFQAPYHHGNGQPSEPPKQDSNRNSQSKDSGEKAEIIRETAFDIVGVAPGSMAARQSRRKGGFGSSGLGLFRKHPYFYHDQDVSTQPKDKEGDQKTPCLLSIAKPTPWTTARKCGGYHGWCIRIHACDMMPLFLYEFAAIS